MKKALKYILLSVLFLTGMSSCIKEDTNMDPNNPEYRAALNNMNGQRTYNYGGYNTSQSGNMGGTGCTCCDICAAYMCADCLCSCCRTGC